MNQDTDPEGESSEFTVDLSPAVAVVDPGIARRASTMSESPARIVAILDRPESSPYKGHDVADALTARRMVTLAVALLAVGCGVAVAMLVSRSGASDPAPELSAVREIPTVSIADSGSSQATSMSDDLDAPGMSVAGIRIINAASVIAGGSATHREMATGLGVTLDPDANCWFSARGGELATTLYCGPVIDKAGDESYHAFPLSFIEVEGGLEAFEAPSKGLTAVSLPVGTVLVGTVDPPMPARGERAAAEGE